MVRRILGIVLLVVAVLLLPLVIYAAVRGDFQTAFAVWIIAFPAGLGGWRLTERARGTPRYSPTDLAFARLLKENNRQVSAAGLAAVAQIPLAEARSYLDEKALVLDARFTRDEQGKEIYIFDRFPARKQAQ